MDDFKVEPLKVENPLRLPQFGPTLKIGLVILVLALIGLALFLILGRSAFVESKVLLSIESASEIASGDEVTFTIRYSNSNRSALTQAKLVFTYPPDAVALRDGAVTDAVSETIDLGTIGPNAVGEKTFTALVVGSQGAILPARAVLTFQPEGLAAQLQKTAERKINITSLPIQLTAVAAPTVLNGQPVSFLIDYRNASTEVFSSLRIVARIPEGFTPSAITPKNTGTSPDRASELFWDIPELSAAQGARITIQGSLIGRERESKTLLVLLQRPMPSAAGARYVTLEKAEASSVIASPLLSLSTTVQDRTDYTAHLGNLLKYKLVVANNSDADLASLTLTARLEGIMFDAATVESTGAFDGRTITWNSAVVPGLGTLRAHESVTVPFTVRLKSTFPGSLGTGGSLVKVSSRVETLIVPEFLHVDTLSVEDQLVTQISTATAFNQDLAANSPQANHKSIFTVHWSLSNPANDVSPAQVTATVFPGVSWEGNVQVVGTTVQPTYNARLSTLTWNLGTLPSGVGVTFPAYELTFRISATPSQTGQPINLLKDVTLSGTDVLTKEKITQRASDVRSDIVQP